MSERDETTSGETGPALGPDDYLVLTNRVHVMRFQGRTEEGHRWWRLACGSRHVDLDAVWVDGSDVEAVALDFCGNCVRTKVSTNGGPDAVASGDVTSLSDTGNRHGAS